MLFRHQYELVLLSLTKNIKLWEDFNMGNRVSSQTSRRFEFLFWWLLVWKVPIHKCIFLQIYLNIKLVSKER